MLDVVSCVVNIIQVWMFYHRTIHGIILTLILLTWRILRAPNNASKWQMGFNLVFKGLRGLKLMFYHVRRAMGSTKNFWLAYNEV